MAENLLVFVFSDSCGACTSFKQSIYPRLQAELKNINYLELNFPTFSIPSSGSLNYNGKNQIYHKQLHTLVEHFPFIFFVNEKNWKDNKDNTSTLKINKFPAEDGISKTLISEWIQKTISNNTNNYETTDQVQNTENSESKKFRVLTYGEYIKDKN